MAKVDLKKIRIVGLKEHYKILVPQIHKLANLHVIPLAESTDGNTEQDRFFHRYDLARIAFAIETLIPHEGKKSKLDAILSGGKLVMNEAEASTQVENFMDGADDLLDEVSQLHEDLIRHQNELAKIPKKLELLDHIGGLSGELQAHYTTQESRTWIGSVGKKLETAFLASLAAETNLLDIEVLSRPGDQIYFRITAHNETIENVETSLSTYNFESIDSGVFSEHYGQEVGSIREYYLDQQKELGIEITSIQERFKNLAEHLDDFRILYDFELWKKQKDDLQDNVYLSDWVFAITAWIDLRELKSFEKWVNNAFAGDVSVEIVEPDTEEVPPTLMENKTGIRSFEPIISMYGLPGHKDLDPTAWVAPFFFVFFGLCLSDVGYGLILALLSLFFLLFGRMSSGAKHSLALLLFCGVGAILGGIVLGGYFGMTVEQAPAFLVDTSTGLFKGQFFAPLEGAGPMTFLKLSLGLGLIHLLVGLILSGVKSWINGNKSSAILDAGVWFILIASLGLFGFGGDLNTLISQALQKPIDIVDTALMGKIAIIGAALIVLTQGRSQKNWLMKPITGVLALYGATSYLSDILSYARIMALGLATGVVGFAMNLTAGVLNSLLGDMIAPAVGIIVAVVIIVFGHALNFALSLLGAFIHSGRLQFIEFFGKFYDAGGKAFTPFGRKFKYLFLRSKTG